MKILQKFLRSSTCGGEGVLLDNRRIEFLSGGRFLVDFYPARTAHPHDNERLSVILMVHLGGGTGARDARPALDLTALEVDLSVAAAGVLDTLLRRHRVISPMLAHRIGVARQAVVLVGASGRKALTQVCRHGWKVYRVFAWGAIRLNFAKIFWGCGDLA